MHTLSQEMAWETQVEDFLKEAYYSGERFILEGRGGVKAALVPLEDLEVLEEIDP